MEGGWLPRPKSLGRSGSVVYSGPEQLYTYANDCECVCVCAFMRVSFVPMASLKQKFSETKNILASIRQSIGSVGLKVEHKPKRLWPPERMTDVCAQQTYICMHCVSEPLCVQQKKNGTQWKGIRNETRGGERVMAMGTNDGWTFEWNVISSISSSYHQSFPS